MRVFSEVNETFEAETMARRFCLRGSSLPLTEVKTDVFDVLLHKEERKKEHEQQIPNCISVFLQKVRSLLTLPVSFPGLLCHGLELEGRGTKRR